ncbi:MAG: tRNA lysidine(34) synthetase TilS [Cyclobacteriaceae bacterium]
MSVHHSFSDRFVSFLSELIGDGSGTQFLLAVSGGIDSMVMLQLFHEARLSFEVAHCNFGLRGEASDGDETFVKEATALLGVNFHSKRFTTASMAKERGISTQMAARDLRYTWFEELMAQGNFDFLCTAHHRGDHAETILFNLVKGTGIAGLHGIRAIRDQLLRPLMAFNRDEIEVFAGQQDVQWREDASNESNKYSRNLIRNEVMPLLKQINPLVEQSVWQSSQRIAKVESWLADEVAQWKEKLLNQEAEVVFIATPLLNAHPHRTLILSELIRPFGFSYAEIDDIVDKKKERSGRQFSTSEYDLVWDRDQMVITSKREEAEDAIIITGPGKYSFLGVNYKVEIVKKTDWQLQRTNDILQADADKIEWPMTLRTWRKGDSIQPLGMKGRKKVSDLMIDEKVPLNLKSRQPVLEDKADIIWLPGLRVSESVKVSETTQSIMILSKT